MTITPTPLLKSLSPPDMQEAFVDSRYAKSGPYAITISEILDQGICPLCPNVFPGKWHTHPILKTEAGFIITRNMFPYPNAREHLLIVGNQHKEHLAQLTPKDMTHILSLAKWATTELHLPGGLLALRFGDTRFTGATIKHLHAHLVVPSEIDGKVSTVSFPIG